MEMRQLRYFVVVAEEGSILRAARRLHVSQPPLSTQIKNLEQELGVRLLDRSHRGVALTVAGEVFFRASQTLLERLEQAKRETVRAGRGEAGTLSVGFVSLADYGILPPALKNFRAALPLADVQLHELTTDAQLRELRADRLDLGIGLGPVAEPDVTFERLLREELILAAPSGHACLRKSGPVDLRSLSQESFIVPPREIAPGLFDLTISCCRTAGFAPRITQHARQMQTVVGLVASALGVALVPASIGNLTRAGVVYRPLRGRAALIELGILSLSGSQSALRERFIAALRTAAKFG
jgi:DNA-binding transcriptional LysR family regulator